MNKKDLRIIFMGTPEFAVGTLQALVEGGYNVVAVVTQPDKPVGRHQDTLQPSEVKKYALSHGLPVLQPEKMKDPVFVEQLRDYHADLQVVVAFRMLPEVVWAMPRFGTFNVHAALLPQYRGAAPINWAVINGETETGVTTFFLDHDIDTGRIIKQSRCHITPKDNANDIYLKLMKKGAIIAKQTINAILEGKGLLRGYQQNNSIGGALRTAPKIFRENCRISWDNSAQSVYNFIRGLSPYPGAWTTILVGANDQGSQLKVFKASLSSFPIPLSPYKRVLKKRKNNVLQTGSLIIDKNRLYIKVADGCIEILELQLTGKRRMTARDFINGFRGIEEARVK